MKPKHIYIPLSIFLIAAAMIVYFISSNPRYSFYLVGQSIKNHDIELFSKYVDIDAIVEEWVDWSSQKAQQELEAAAHAQNNTISEGFVNLLMPTMRIKLKDEFTKTITESIENPKKNSGLSGLPIINLTLLPIHRLNIEKRIATVEILHPTTEEKIIFKMRRMPQHYWRITSIQVPSLMETSMSVAQSKPTKPQTLTLRQEQQTTPAKNTPPAPPVDKKNLIQEMVLASLERDSILSKTIVYTEYFNHVKEKIMGRLDETHKEVASGEVHLKLTLLADGQIKNMKILDEKTTADNSLKQVVIQSVKDALPYPAFPKELNYTELELNIPISFDSK